MVSSRHRSSVTSVEPTPVKISKPPLEHWTTKEKLYLAALALKFGNSWNSVARNMQAYVEKDRPEGWSNQKTCAAQFDKLMNELGVDKRPKRNESSDGNSLAVIYKKMSEKRIKELEENIINYRKSWLATKNDLEELDSGTLAPSKSDQIKQKIKPSSGLPAKPTSKTSSNTGSSDSEKQPTRALTRRESSRQNLEKTLALLCEQAADIKALNHIGKPVEESEREFYNKVILKPIDISVIKQRLGHEVDDPHAVINELMIMFQNAIMFYPPNHLAHKTAIELRDKMVPQWERALLDRFKSRH